MIAIDLILVTGLSAIAIMSVVMPLENVSSPSDSTDWHELFGMHFALILAVEKQHAWSCRPETLTGIDSGQMLKQQFYRVGRAEAAGKMVLLLSCFELCMG